MKYTFSVYTTKKCLLFAVALLLHFLPGTPIPAVRAQGEIQTEIPRWSQGKEPDWNQRAVWSHKRFGDASNDTHVLRWAAEQGHPNSMAILAARTFAAEGKYAQALAEFKHAAELGNVPYDEWGDALEASGNRGEALRAYQQIVYATGVTYGPKGDLVPDVRDWKDAQGRSLRETVLKNPMNGRPWKAGSVNRSPSTCMRYTLLLIKSGQYAEAIQVRKWAIETLAQNRDRLFEKYEWLETEFTASAIRRDPSLFVAQAWTIIGLFDNTRRTEDFPGVIAIIRYQKAIAARPDFTPAQVLLAENYRFIGEHYDKTYLSLAAEAYEAARHYGKGEDRTKATASLKELRDGEKSKTIMVF